MTPGSERKAGIVVVIYRDRLLICVMIRIIVLTLVIGLFAACASSTVTAPLATDDCGPKPSKPKEIVAAWFNAQYKYTPPTPLTGDDFTIVGPTKIVVSDILGRHVGWQVILGPENKVLTNFTNLNYTRLVINHDQIISVTSSDQAF